MTHKITPFLWFNGQAEEATSFYISVFKNAKAGRVTKGPNGAVISTTFTLEGQEFMALNGGPQYSFTPAISLFVNCETQREVDELWDKLTAGGKPGRCGWLEDKFGLSWQIIPTVLGKLLNDPDRARAQRVMQAMLKINKLDIAQLEAA